MAGKGMRDCTDSGASGAGPGESRGSERISNRQWPVNDWPVLHVLGPKRRAASPQGGCDDQRVVHREPKTLSDGHCPLGRLDCHRLDRTDRTDLIEDLTDLGQRPAKQLSGAGCLLDGHGSRFALSGFASRLRFHLHAAHVRAAWECNTTMTTETHLVCHRGIAGPLAGTKTRRPRTRSKTLRPESSPSTSATAAASALASIVFTLPAHLSRTSVGARP